MTGDDQSGHLVTKAVTTGSHIGISDAASLSDQAPHPRTDTGMDVNLRATTSQGSDQSGHLVTGGDQSGHYAKRHPEQNSAYAEASRSDALSARSGTLLSSTAQIELYTYLHNLAGGTGVAVSLVASAIKTALGMDKRTFWRILGKWEARGMIRRESTRSGIELTLLMTPPQFHGGPAVTTVSQAPTSPAMQTSHEAPWPFGLTREVYRERYPNLANCGFGLNQLQQIQGLLASKDISTELVVVSLDYAEWELAHGSMIDGKGEAVSSPADWVYKALATHGYYRRPKDYEDPLEKARAALEAEVSRKKAALAEMQRLRDEQASLEMDEIIETETERLLANEDDPLMQELLREIPPFIKSRGKESELFTRELRRRLRKRFFDEK
jgi:hypothetical protein